MHVPVNDLGLEEDAYYSSAEIKALLLVARKHFLGGKFNRVRNCFLLRFALNSGLRVEELSDLLHGDVFVEMGKCYVVVRAGKGDKRRIVTISEELREEYLAYCNWKRTECLSTEHSGPVFCKSTGGKLSVRAIQKAYTLCAREAGLERTNIHCLRHTYITHLLECGAPVRLVQKLAGHSSLQTTQRYIGISKNRQIIRESLSRLYCYYSQETEKPKVLNKKKSRKKV